MLPSQDSIFLPDLLLMPQLEDAYVFQALDADIVTNIFHDGVALGLVVGDWGGLSTQKWTRHQTKEI